MGSAGNGGSVTPHWIATVFSYPKIQVSRLESPYEVIFFTIKLCTKLESLLPLGKRQGNFSPSSSIFQPKTVYHLFQDCHRVDLFAWQALLLTRLICVTLISSMRSFLYSLFVNGLLQQFMTTSPTGKFWVVLVHPLLAHLQPDEPDDLQNAYPEKCIHHHYSRLYRRHNSPLLLLLFYHKINGCQDEKTCDARYSNSVANMA